MNYNGAITRRINALFRKIYWMPMYRKQLKNHHFSLICNNCNGGFIMHDCGEEFRTPTVNLFFPGTGFYDFVENLDYYLHCEVKELENPDVNYPCGVIGDTNYKEVIIHFMHYHSFDEAKKKWEKRREKVNFDDLYIIWTFMGGTWPELFQRFEALPISHKVAFVNSPQDPKYKSLYYIRGFEQEEGLGVLSLYQNLLGKRYYDQFDFIKWFNTGKW